MGHHSRPKLLERELQCSAAAHTNLFGRWCKRAIGGGVCFEVGISGNQTGARAVLFSQQTGAFMPPQHKHNTSRQNPATAEAHTQQAWGFWAASEHLLGEAVSPTDLVKIGVPSG